MRSTRFLRIAAATLALVVSGTLPLRAQAPVTVRVGAFPLDNNGPIYYAQDLGYFKDAGITVESRKA
jgi:ABC-type nitrate/sulfonate/bicarbonate transport system substrate-binding protein